MLARLRLVSKHDRRAYFRIVPMQLAEARDWFRALVQSIQRGCEQYCSDSGQIKRKAKNIETAIPKRSVFSSS